MKKLSFLVLSLLAVLMFTACDNGDDPVNKQTLSIDISSRAINGDEVIFAQSSSSAEINFTDQTITITSGYKDCDGIGHKLTTTDMKLTQEIGMTYSFKSGSAPFGEASDLSGYVDLATGMIWYTFTANGSDKIFSTNHPLYSYGTITVTNPDNGNHMSYTDSQIMFAIDPTGRKCTMVMTNFAPNLVGAIQSYQIYWENLTLTPTATGYTISADQAESSLKGTNTITDVTIKLDDQCRALNGSFKCNDLDITVTSNMFPTADLY